MVLIHRYPGTSPCLVVADTKFRNPRLLEEIKAGMYTHILLGPEQATSPEFCKVLQEPSFQQQVGLVAIDECHVLNQWRMFQDTYIMIHELQWSFLSSTAFFGCLATMDVETEKVVKKLVWF